jgi:hypothetical protein
VNRLARRVERIEAAIAPRTDYDRVVTIIWDPAVETFEEVKLRYQAEKGEPYPDDDARVLKIIHKIIDPSATASP